MNRRAVIVAARRTAVAPRGGALKHLQADELAAPVIQALLADTGLSGRHVDQLILGNALYGGGNPARLAGLRAGIPESVPALTIDTQCCSGLDSILHAARLVEAGAADCVLAGGAESFSRAPIRAHRPMGPDGEPKPYDRPPFTPWPDRDPDLTDAAAGLADKRKITRKDQARFAVGSHGKARVHEAATGWHGELVEIAGTDLARDAFTRKLTEATASRAPILAGDQSTGISAATAAVEADAAALVCVLSEKRAGELGLAVH
jgi:acetyl-CoA C-acetyltransferase